MFPKRWKRTVNIKDLLTDDDSPPECERVAKAIARRLRTAFPEPRDDLEDIVCDFENISADDKRPELLINGSLDDLYDWADAERVWLGL